MGWISETKHYKQQLYGWYCNSARQQGAVPLSYNDWEKKGCPKKYIKVKEGLNEK